MTHDEIDALIVQTLKELEETPTVEIPVHRTAVLSGQVATEDAIKPRTPRMSHRALLASHAVAANQWLGNPPARAAWRKLVGLGFMLLGLALPALSGCDIGDSIESYIDPPTSGVAAALLPPPVTSHPRRLDSIDVAQSQCPDADQAQVQLKVQTVVKQAFSTVAGIYPTCRVDHDVLSAEGRTVTVACLDIGIVEGVLTQDTFAGVVRLGACYLPDGTVTPHVVSFIGTISSER